MSDKRDQSGLKTPTSQIESQTTYEPVVTADQATTSAKLDDNYKENYLTASFREFFEPIVRNLDSSVATLRFPSIIFKTPTIEPYKKILKNPTKETAKWTSAHKSMSYLVVSRSD
jgi:hypothetical protein